MQLVVSLGQPTYDRKYHRGEERGKKMDNILAVLIKYCSSDSAQDLRILNPTKQPAYQ